jgi:amino acid permease
MIPSGDLLTREEVLGGLPARQASTLLFLIESRTAHLVAQSRRVTERFLTEDAEQERELAFYEALTLGRDPKPPPTIQDLECFTPQWAQLVPENASLRAAIARALGQKYVLTYQAVPGIRLVLGLDEGEVQAAYRSLYREPLGAIYTAAPGLAERLRWAWASLSARLENLPAFWSVYALTLTETVGAGVLALPIAVAGIGPLPGVIILAVLGLVNVLTIAFMAEAVARSGTIRYGSAYVGRMVADFLGDMGSVVLSGSLMTICALALLAYYIGFSTTMASVIPLPAEAWVALLFAVGLYFVSREALNMTVASALVVGAINIGLILILSLLAFAHLQPENLAYANVPFIHGAPFEPSILALIFGVVLSAYFGHLSVSTVSKTVMRRDPSGRSLIWGAAAAQLTAMVLYCIWVLAVNGAIGPRQLAGETGTALVPLAAQVGPTVSVFGSIFVILGMGMASIHFSLGLFGLSRERLPMQPCPTLTMPSGRARLLFRRFGARSPHLALTYLGLDGDQPRFAFNIYVDGRVHRVEARVGERWQANDLPERVRALVGGKIRLELEILGATQQNVRLRVKSPMRVAYEGEWDIGGLSVANVLTLPEAQSRLVTWITRRGGAVSLSAAAEYVGLDQTAARKVLDGLAGQGFLRQVEGDGEPHYRSVVGYRRGSRVAQQLLEPSARGATPPSTVQKPGATIGRAISGDRGRFLLSITPLVLIFLLAEWSIITGSQTFSGILSLLGVLVVSLLAGIFPVFLLISSRQKGEFVPKVVYRLMGNPVILTFIYLLCLSGIFLHGLVIWDGLVERTAALIVGVLAVVMTVVMAGRGAFSSRAVVELREDQSQEGRSLLSIVVGGRPGLADAWLDCADGEHRIEARGSEAIPALSALRSAAIYLLDAPARELKVWLHRVTREGNSEGLPAQVEVRCGDEVQQAAPNLTDGQIIFPLHDEPEQLHITLSEARG